MCFVPKMNGVECEETLWKYSPKSWGMHIKKVPTGMLLPEGTFLIIEMIITYLLEILELDAVCL